MIEILPFQCQISQKSPQVVKHVVKCEKRACSTLEVGKSKPIMFIAKTWDFKRFSEKIKENRRFVWASDFGLSDTTWTCGIYHPKSWLSTSIDVQIHTVSSFSTLLCGKPPTRARYLVIVIYHKTKRFSTAICAKITTLFQIGATKRIVRTFLQKFLHPLLMLANMGLASCF